MTSLILTDLSSTPDVVAIDDRSTFPDDRQADVRASSLRLELSPGHGMPLVYSEAGYFGSSECSGGAVFETTANMGDPKLSSDTAAPDSMLGITKWHRCGSALGCVGIGHPVPGAI